MFSVEGKMCFRKKERLFYEKEMCVQGRRGGCSQEFGITPRVLECSQNFEVALSVLE